MCDALLARNKSSPVFNSTGLNYTEVNNKVTGELLLFWIFGARVSKFQMSGFRHSEQNFRVEVHGRPRCAHFLRPGDRGLVWQTWKVWPVATYKNFSCRLFIKEIFNEPSWGKYFYYTATPLSWTLEGRSVISKSALQGPSTLSCVLRLEPQIVIVCL